MSNTIDGAPLTRPWSGVLELTGGKIASLGRVWNQFLLLASWLLALKKKSVAQEQPILN